MAGALSIKRMTLRPVIRWSKAFSHRSNTRPIIHAFALASYITPRLLRLIRLKHRGFKYLPITSGLSLSVSLAFAQSATVNRSLFFFLPLKRVVASFVSGSSLLTH